ncbi:MAG: CBS domain-containing protein, partial [Candidatus Promineifilaceae bacterium]
MLLILTHENADFDAVASQVAAERLYPDATALLPWRVNRNVKQYLSLYAEALPLVRPEDWQRQRVERVLLVDSQSLPSVRGIRAGRVEVRVIDHHEAPAERPAGWSFQIEPVGATTTILAEMLQAAGLRLSANEATLLLLGIHEDTGSLVYDTTSPRDVQAAGWLLAEGAQLPVVRRFLNIPLSDAQQQLLEQIQANLAWLTLEGQSVALAAVEAPPDFEEEISAVAHRLREVDSPDALVLLVQLKPNHVQLVARSSVEAIDVSLLARAFGGGGHSRAAAATIMDRPLAALRQELEARLEQAVRPVARVAEIMSHGVQTLPADASVRAAAEQMRRFGHEGYPIVDPEAGQIVGLLTRRMVDRAISHQLADLPVSQLMRPGRVTVRPSDSVAAAQRLMIEEGWGQIPVVAEGAEGEQALLGIVTRTDVISLLSARPEQDGRPQQRERMAAGLPAGLWALVQAISGAAAELDLPVYFVGGLVRDLLLGRPPGDIDIVVEGDALALVRRLQRRFGGGRRSHARFGTAKWLVPAAAWRTLAPGAAPTELPQAIDFVSARTEFYTRPTALPEVERGSIKLDLHRRDFSINTLAIRLDGAHLGELLDFYGGRRDLELGLIRVLHSLSYIDDPTRILRAIRLEQRLGFELEARTTELIAGALPLLDRVSGERIRSELELILLEPNRASILARLDAIGVLVQLEPRLDWDSERAEAFGRVESLLAEAVWRPGPAEISSVFVYFAIWLLPLTDAAQERVMARLRVRNATRQDVLTLGKTLHKLASLPAEPLPSQVVKALDGTPRR